jgi:nucleotide-binding universal stress UspA family protein
MYKHILLPTDGSPLSQRAVREGIRFAESVGARITALHVTAPFQPTIMNPGAIAARAGEHEAESRASARRALDFVTGAAAASGVPCAVLHRINQMPWDEIVTVAESHECELIFMGSHGRRGLSALLLGSETQNVVTHTAIPVLVVH